MLRAPSRLEQSAAAGERGRGEHGGGCAEKREKERGGTGRGGRNGEGESECAELVFAAFQKRGCRACTQRRGFLCRRRGSEAVRCVTRFCLEVENETAPTPLCVSGKREKKNHAANKKTTPISSTVELFQMGFICVCVCVFFLLFLPLITLPYAERLPGSAGSIHSCPCTARGSPEQPHGCPLSPCLARCNHTALRLSFTLLRITTF